MHFQVTTTIPLSQTTRQDTCFLIPDKWDDWFTYETMFQAVYFDKNGRKRDIGGVKIGQKDQEGRRPDIPSNFERLDEKYFSLGVDVTYYEEAKHLKKRDEYFQALNDMAYNLDIFSEAVKHDVTTVSLMRDITASTIRGQFHRIAHGGARLTDYNFTYFPPQKSVHGQQLAMDFNVEIEKMPPTNIHVLIGKNGAGKTTVLKKLLYAIEEIGDSAHKYGRVEGDTGEFANIVYVSFSAFDQPTDFSDYHGELPVPYTFVGLVGDDVIKTRSQLSEEFLSSLYKITQGTRRRLWEDTIDILESDNTFLELQIKNWVSPELSMAEERAGAGSRREGESRLQYRKRIEKEAYEREILPRFETLSSGHKIILLTVARLVELVEEKTLVLLDEPEEHLHPPLVSALIRALSNLLIYRNGVGIIATHSPVILQEVPGKCVWILRRSGKLLAAERPDIETFGENLGELTRVIFGYEVINSGFHKMLRDTAEKKETYQSALRAFHNELGEEARAILKAYMWEKEHGE